MSSSSISSNQAPKSNSRNTVLEVSAHIIVWAIIFMLPYLMRLSYPAADGRNPARDGNILWVDTITKAILVVVFYLNAFVLVPRFLNKPKAFVYAGIVVLTLFSVAAIHHQSVQHWGQTKPQRAPAPGGRNDFGPQPRPDKPFNDFKPKGPPPPPDKSFNAPNPKESPKQEHRDYMRSLMFNLTPFFLTIVASILYRVMRDKSRNEVLLQQRQEASLNAELSFLRSQISPHFLFNILNNVAALARMKSDQLEPTVIKLSQLLRYMLYDANEAKVPLTTELAYLSSYIDLQRQRFGRKVAIGVSLPQLNMEQDPMIEPMLLIPFVENAFKHGVGLISNPEIDIQLNYDNGVLTFNVKNKYNLDEEEVKDEASGIGFNNVVRRLNLLYEHKHELEIARRQDSKGDNWYIATLRLTLNDTTL
ncbi:MAG: histidine kinase [Edaphocola sp.]